MLKWFWIKFVWPSLAPTDHHMGMASYIISIVKFGGHFDYEVLNFALRVVLMSYECLDAAETLVCEQSLSR